MFRKRRLSQVFPLYQSRMSHFFTSSRSPLSNAQGLFPKFCVGKKPSISTPLRSRFFNRNLRKTPKYSSKKSFDRDFLLLACRARRAEQFSYIDWGISTYKLWKFSNFSHKVSKTRKSPFQKNPFFLSFFHSNRKNFCASINFRL